MSSLLFCVECCEWTFYQFFYFRRKKKQRDDCSGQKVIYACFVCIVRMFIYCQLVLSDILICSNFSNFLITLLFMRASLLSAASWNNVYISWKDCHVSQYDWLSNFKVPPGSGPSPFQFILAQIFLVTIIVHAHMHTQTHRLVPRPPLAFQWYMLSVYQWKLGLAWACTHTHTHTLTFQAKVTSLLCVMKVVAQHLVATLPTLPVLPTRWR